MVTFEESQSRFENDDNVLQGIRNSEPFNLAQATFTVCSSNVHMNFKLPVSTSNSKFSKEDSFTNSCNNVDSLHQLTTWEKPRCELSIVPTKHDVLFSICPDNHRQTMSEKGCRNIEGSKLSDVFRFAHWPGNRRLRQIMKQFTSNEYRINKLGLCNGFQTGNKRKRSLPISSHYPIGTSFKRRLAALSIIDEITSEWDCVGGKVSRNLCQGRFLQNQACTCNPSRSSDIEKFIDSRDNLICHCGSHYWTVVDSVVVVDILEHELLLLSDQHFRNFDLVSPIADQFTSQKLQIQKFSTSEILKLKHKMKLTKKRKRKDTHHNDDVSEFLPSVREDSKGPPAGKLEKIAHETQKVKECLTSDLDQDIAPKAGLSELRPHSKETFKTKLTKSVSIQALNLGVQQSFVPKVTINFATEFTTTLPLVKKEFGPSFLNLNNSIKLRGIDLKKQNNYGHLKYQEQQKKSKYNFQLGQKRSDILASNIFSSASRIQTNDANVVAVGALVHSYKDFDDNCLPFRDKISNALAKESHSVDSGYIVASDIISSASQIQTNDKSVLPVVAPVYVNANFDDHYLPSRKKNSNGLTKVSHSGKSGYVNCNSLPSLCKKPSGKRQRSPCRCTIGNPHNPKMEKSFKTVVVQNVLRPVIDVVTRKQDVLVVRKEYGNTSRYFYVQGLESWPGNVYFQLVIDNFRSAINDIDISEYSNTNPNVITKKNVTRAIMAEIFRVGGRFLLCRTPTRDVKPIQNGATQFHTNGYQNSEYDVNRDDNVTQIVKVYSNKQTEALFSKMTFEWDVVECKQCILRMIDKFVKMKTTPKSQKLSLKHTAISRKITESSVTNAPIENPDAIPSHFQHHVDGFSNDNTFLVQSLSNVPSILDCKYSRSSNLVFSSDHNQLVNHLNHHSIYETQSVRQAPYESTTNKDLVHSDDVIDMNSQHDVATQSLSPRLLLLQSELNEVCARIQINDPAVTCVDIDKLFTDEMIQKLGHTLYQAVLENKNDPSQQYVTAMGLEIKNFRSERFPTTQADGPYHSLFLFLEQSPVLQTVFLNGNDLSTLSVTTHFLQVLARSTALKCLIICNMSLTLLALESLIHKNTSLEILELEGCTLKPDSATPSMISKWEEESTVIVQNTTLRHVIFKGEGSFHDEFMIPLLRLLRKCDRLEKISLRQGDNGSFQNNFMLSADVSQEVWHELADLVKNHEFLNHVSFSSWNFCGNDLEALTNSIHRRCNIGDFQVSFAASCRADTVATDCIMAMFGKIEYQNPSQCPSRGATILHIGHGCKFSKPLTALLHGIATTKENSMKEIQLRSVSTNTLAVVLQQTILKSSTLTRLDLGSTCFSDIRRLRSLMLLLPYFEHLRELTLNVVVDSGDVDRKTKTELLDSFRRNSSLFRVNFLQYDESDDTITENNNGTLPVLAHFWSDSELKELKSFWQRNEFLATKDMFSINPSVFPTIAMIALQMEYGYNSIFRWFLSMGDLCKVSNGSTELICSKHDQRGQL